MDKGLEEWQKRIIEEIYMTDKSSAKISSVDLELRDSYVYKPWPVGKLTQQAQAKSAGSKTKSMRLPDKIEKAIRVIEAEYDRRPGQHAGSACLRDLR